MSPRAGILGLTATLGWVAVMHAWAGRNFYPPLGLLALGLLIAVFVLYRNRLADWLRPSRRNVMAGLGLGLATAALTHLGYALLAGLWPGLRPAVVALYGTVWLGPGPFVALPVVVLAVVVEELVWRGVLLDAAMHSPDAGARRMLILTGSTVSYTVAQAGSASWALALVALVLGLFWGVQRLWDGSLVSALLTHLIWTLSVLVFLPLETLPH